MRCYIPFFAAMVVVAALGGGCKATAPGKLSAVQPTSDAPRAGNAYLLRGFIGVFSQGIDQLTAKINESGVRANVYQDDQWAVLADTICQKYKTEPNHEPIILVGHSYGADDVVRIARKLADDNVTVDMLITIDPVTPPKVPGNVKTCINIYQSNGAMDALPWLRGVPLQAEQPGPAKLLNVNIREDRTDLLEPGTDHFNIEKKAKIHSEVLKQVLTACPPRATWVAQIAGKSTSVASASVKAPVDAKPAPARPVAMSNGGVDRRESD